MRIATSFSGRLFYWTGQLSLKSIAEAYGTPESPILAYHEDSYENLNPLSARHICEIDKINNVQYIDTFKVDKHISKIVENPRYATAKDYFDTHAPFFFRKIAAIKHAASTIDTDILLWLDSDCFVKKPFGNFLEFVKKYDIVYFDRIKCTTETGVLFFNLRNPKVHDMINKWYDIYKTQEIFAVEHWADTYAFDYVRQKYFPDLKYGKLNNGEGKHLWRDVSKDGFRGKEHYPYKNWYYIDHLKSPNSSVRKASAHKSDIKGNCGHLYIGFGQTYDNVAAYSCARLREFSNFPIHVVSNLLPQERSVKWSEVNNVSFSYLPYQDIDNRIIKTSLVFYSPFDYTLYTDADSLIHSKEYEDMFRLLYENDIVLPLYSDNNTYSRIHRNQAVAFKKALDIINIPEFNKQAKFSIIAGAVCAFRKNKLTQEFFTYFNDYWERTGGLRDMPPLAIAYAIMKSKMRIKLVDYTKYASVGASVIESCHCIHKDYKFLPKFIRLHPDVEKEKWVYKK